MDRRPHVDVVILTWNDGDLLEVAVGSALRSRDVDVDVYVVDNGSSPPASPPDDPRVHLIRNEENRGVAPARAQGIAEGDAELVCLLDSDAELHDDTLAKLAEVILDDGTVALAAPVFDDQHPDESGGVKPSSTVKLQRALGKASTYQGPPMSAEGRRDVDFAIGACQLFRRSAHDSIGGLDTTIFYGPEDVDFCLRLRKAGWRIVQRADANCLHPPRRRNRRLISSSGVRHATAIGKYLWKHRHFADDVEPGEVVSYRIHDLCWVDVEQSLPSAHIIEEILGHFRVDDRPDEDDEPVLAIASTVERASRRAGTNLLAGARGPGFTYGPGWFTMNDGETLIAREGRGLAIGSTVNVDRALMTYLDWLTAPLGAGLVHAAAVAVDGRAALISGWGGVGKTATLAGLCREDGAEFVADDMVWISDDATAYALPKPMYIYPYHEPVFPELFAGDHKPLVPTALTPATEKVRVAVKPLFTAMPSVENWARRVTPEHMKTPPQVALPGVRIADRSSVSLIIRLERGSTTKWTLEEISADELVDGLVNEYFGEQTTGTGLPLPMAASSSGVYPLQDWLADRTRIMTAAVKQPTLIRIRVPVHADATSTSTFVRQAIYSHLG